MKKINNIDFADSSFKCCEMSPESLNVYLTSWDNNIIKISFKKPIEFKYRLPSVVADLFQILDDSSFLYEALTQKYETIPSDHPFKLFALVDIDDFPFFQIVAEDVHICKIPNCPP